MKENHYQIKQSELLIAQNYCTVKMTVKMMNNDMRKK